MRSLPCGIMFNHYQNDQTLLRIHISTLLGPKEKKIQQELQKIKCLEFLLEIFSEFLNSEQILIILVLIK